MLSKRDRVAAYKATFFTNEAKVDHQGALSPAAEIVLRDLASYCYAKKPTLIVSPVSGMTDPYAMAFADGRRDVYNRIMTLCNLTQEQVDRFNQGAPQDE